MGYGENCRPGGLGPPDQLDDVVVAIIDTGIDYTHPDLAANIYTVASAVVGYTCIGGSCVAGGLDDFGHGTHVAGTISAVGNNGVGIAGINWAVKLLSLKFLDSNGSGYISDAVLAFNLVAQLKSSGVNIRVTSNSWGGGGFDQSLKDAMSAVEALGIVNVCAAGNSAVNADFSPMYPAAYDNRGIISVLASDSNDLGAYFTNYGLASVDIAAPGVNTLSTVPTGSCTLCDPSGYTLLSGTSMATPHVSGVVAALLHRNPTLTADLARDEILDPGSYDTLTDPLAMSTSTGGRLNFYKAITNTSFLTNPHLNNFPTLTMGPNVFASASEAVSLTATGSDPDGDPLRYAWGKSTSTGTQWLFGWMLGNIFPAPSGSGASFNAPYIDRTATVPYGASVADGRGGGASGQAFVTVSPETNPGSPPSGSLTLSSNSIAVGGNVTVNFPVTDSKGGPLPWDMWASGLYGASGWCCFTGSSSSITFSSAGVYRIGVQAIDQELNLSTRPTAVVSVGGATGTPPIAAATVDKLSGPVPLTVNFDMSGSTDPDGTISYYYFICGGTGFATGSTSPKGSCTYTTPGAYWNELEVQDNSGYVDIISVYTVATPVGGGDTTPPTVSITSPGNGASVFGTTAISANASDDPGGSGVKEVDFYLDTTTLLGTATSGSPYTINWDTSSVTPGAHTLTAKATDFAGNTGTSSSVSITVTNFTIGVSPTSASVNQGLGTTTKATVTPLNGFNGIVTFSVTGAPAGLTTGFSPATVTGSGSSTLTLTATAVAAGVYPLTVTGSSGTLTHSATFTLTVKLGGALSVTASPASIKVSRSTSPSVTTTIKVTGSSGFLGPVTLTASGLPGGATASFTPTSVNVAPGSPGSSTLKVTVSSKTKIGNSSLTVTAKSNGGPQAQTKLTLQVTK